MAQQYIFTDANELVLLVKMGNKRESRIFNCTDVQRISFTEFTEKKFFGLKTVSGRRITFEYALIRGENDRPEDVQRLVRSLRGMLCHVNLIPLNEVKETGFTGSSRKRAAEIAAQLESAGIPATVRRELGREIDGACGQLRLRHKNSMHANRISGCPKNLHGVQ